MAHLDDVLDTLEELPFLLVLDGITDPATSAPACGWPTPPGFMPWSPPRTGPSASPTWRSRRPAAPPRRSPYVMVTNLARTLRELKEREIWVVGTAGEAEGDLYAAAWPVATAWVLGAEGEACAA